MMTLEIILARIEEIKTLDDECAHAAEDTLYADVLHAIAHGECENVKECAKLVLTTQALKFSKWYA